MPFASLLFIFYFLPIVLIVNYLIKKEFRNIWIVIASLFFYAWSEKEYTYVLILCIIVNYILGILLEKFKDKTKFITLIAGVIINFSFLIYYKYWNFLIENLSGLEQFTGIKIQHSHVHLPIGISFFVFQAITYIVDIYRGHTAIKNPIDLALFKSMFPQLISGPIVKYSEIDKQISDRSVGIDDFNYGIKRFIVGLAKKVLIANQMAAVTDKIFQLDANQIAYNIALLGILTYTLQIYFDFSGYSDMAIGLAKMIGFKFPENFNYPYISTSIQEFWRRWHISLSSWFREYLYIPLGGNRKGEFRLYLNIIIVFTLTGLWHGASWNFVVWGLFNGCLIVIERLFLGNFLKQKFIKPLAHIYTIFMILISWVFFRSPNLEYAIGYLKSMFGFGKNLSESGYNIFSFVDNEKIFFLVIAVFLSTPAINIIDKYFSDQREQRSIQYFLYNILNRAVLSGLFIYSVMELIVGTYNPFIYFRF